MQIIKKLISIFLTVLLISCFAGKVFAADSTDVKNAKATLKLLKSKLKQFKRQMRKSSVQTALSSSDSSLKGLDDSDDDGLPDIYEHALGSDSCDSDSDDDGIGDGDEGKSGSKPGDSESGEIEIKSTITAKTDTTVTVDGHIFTVSDITRFDMTIKTNESFLRIKFDCNRL